MLGHKLVQFLSGEYEVWATIRHDFSNVERFGIFDRNRIIENTDVTDISSIRGAISTAKPTVVINAAGVIKQHALYDNVIQTLAVNSIFPHRLAELSAEDGFRLITISTDCVFDGKTGNYSEDDAPNARDLYGMSKLLGEVTNENSLTIRTSIIGRELSTAHSIVEWFLAQRGGDIKGYTNAIFSGFPSVVLAGIISRLISEYPTVSGLCHIASEPISKYHLLELLNRYYRAPINIEPSDEVIIDRSLDSSKFRGFTGFKPASWNEMIERMAGDTTPYDSWRTGNRATSN
jgi:dTDP-4-dehydrorhamnose reductase